MHRAIALPAAIRAGSRTSIPRLASTSSLAFASRSDQLRLYSSRLPNASRPSRVVRKAGAATGVPKRLPKSHHDVQHSHEQPEQNAQVGEHAQPAQAVQPSEPSSRAASSTLSGLTAPVKVPQDVTATGSGGAGDLIPTNSSLSSLLSHSSLIVTRQIEMMNIFMGYEQANRYALYAPDAEYVPADGGGGLLSDSEVGLKPVGYLVEEEGSFFGGAMRRQFMRTHRPFKALVMDTEGNVLMRVDRPFTFINSRARIYVPAPTANSLLKDEQNSEAKTGEEEDLLGEVRQVWHPWRRKYDVFKMQRTEEGEEEMVQFAKVDSGLLAWDFLFQDEQGRLLGAVNRNFRGFGRELFTDTGQYVLRFDSLTEASQEDLQAQVAGEKQGEEESRKKIEGSASSQDNAEAKASSTSTNVVPSLSTRSMSLPERALALALAMSADIDYFSRHSQGTGGGMGFMPLWFPFGGGGGGAATQEGQAGASSGHEIDTKRQDSSGVEAPTQAPGDIYGGSGGMGPAVGTGVGYGMMGGGRQSRDSDDGDGPAAPPPAASDGGGGGGEASPWANEDSGGFYDSPTPPPTDGWGGSVGGQGDGGEEVWGANDQDPWGGGGGGDGGGGGGLFGGWSLGDIFGGDE